MNYDIGPAGIAVLVGISLGFGLIVQFVGHAGSRWEWLVGSLAFLIGGLIASELVFAGQDVQPIIDGLSFDESLAGGIVTGIPIAVVTRGLSRRPADPGATPV